MYTAPVIPSDLRHEETIIQAAIALNYLQSTITNIFDRIDKRISKNNAKINELSSRANSASLKIKKLCGTNKAIKIFSPAKFPSAHVFRDIKLTFYDSEALESTLSIYNDNEILSRVDPGLNNIQEKFVFFHFRSAKNKSTAARISSHRGLGDIPANCKSINSVLLFSAVDNVYGARKATDDMNRIQRNRNKKAEVGNSRGLIIEPAPLSLSNRQNNAEKRQQGLFYTPKLNEAPTIDLPADLTDLPGIAGDIQFHYTDTNQIAPSLFFQNFLDQPKAPEDFGSTENNNEGTMVSNAMDQPKSVKSSALTVPSPPPPPLDVHEISSVAPPPPPPPAPPMDTPAVQPKPTSAAPEIIDVRSNLMDAIRKAGGVQGGRLRAAADVARQTSNEQLEVPNKPNVSSGGNLMADLHNKLLMRRKGISGIRDGQADPVGSGNVISLLSSLIPPPKAKAQNSSSDENDGDDADWVD